MQDSSSKTTMFCSTPSLVLCGLHQSHEEEEAYFTQKEHKLPECPMTNQKVPQTSSSALTLSCVMAAHPTGYFWWDTHTRSSWGLLTQWGRPSVPLCACWRRRSQTVSVWQRNTQRKNESLTEPWGHCWEAIQGSVGIIVLISNSLAPPHTHMHTHMHRQPTPLCPSTIKAVCSKSSHEDALLS